MIRRFCLIVSEVTCRTFADGTRGRSRVVLRPESVWSESGLGLVRREPAGTVILYLGPEEDPGRLLVGGRFELTLTDAR